MFLEIADRADWRCVSRTALSSSLLARLVCFSLCKLSFRTQLPPGEEVEHKPAGTKMFIWRRLLVSQLLPSHLLCLALVVCLVCLSQTKPSVKPPQGFSTWSQYSSQPGRTRGIWLRSRPRGEEKEKRKGASWGDNNSEPARIIVRGLFPP